MGELLVFTLLVFLTAGFGASFVYSLGRKGAWAGILLIATMCSFVGTGYALEEIRDPEEQSGNHPASHPR